MATLWAGLLPKKTPHALDRFVPASCTIVPPATLPNAGDTDESCGPTLMKVNAFVSANVACAHVRTTSTVPAPCAGVIAFNCPSFTYVLCAATPPNLSEQVPSSRAPDAMTFVPPLLGPVAGEIEKSTGVFGASVTWTWRSLPSEP